MAASRTKIERQEYARGFRSLAGIDEAGRGPLAGPVVAAACIIPEGRTIRGVNDSKQLTPEQRNKLYARLTEDDTIVWAVGIVDHQTIDLINIYQATVVAMKMAIDGLKVDPDLLLVDGMNLSHRDIPYLRIVDGDCLSQSIAAASILAKVTRDRIMEEQHQLFPQYGFDRHKGYGTPGHLRALSEHGPCEIHRRSFQPVRSAEERPSGCASLRD